MDRRFARAWSLAAAAAFAIGLAGCVRTGGAGEIGVTGAAADAPAQRKHEAHVLVYADGQNFTSLNPHLYQATSLHNMSSFTMAWLARYDAQNRPSPELATVIPTQANGGISKDGKTITWHIRRGVKWSDGVPFDGDDVVFSTKAVLNPKNNEVGRDGWDLIEKIDEPDKFTVVYHLRKPFASYLPIFFGSAGANPCLLPKHILGNLPDINQAPYNALPVGIGPFRYTSWKRGDTVEMEANPYYWRGMPKLKKIVYKVIPDRNTLLTQLQTGEIDLWPLVGQGYYDRVKALPGHTTIKQVGSYYSHIDFNVQRPLVSDVRVRRALRFATDRALIVAKAYHGTGIVQESMIPPVNPAYHAFPKIPYDVTAAGALLDEAGWTARGADGIRTKGGKRLSLEFAIYTGAPDSDTMLELVRTMWRQIGVDLQVRHYEVGLFFALAQNGGIVYGGKFDVTAFSWGGDAIGDISEQYGCTMIPPNGQNVPRWCDKKFDADMAAFKQLYGIKERQPYLDVSIQQILDQVPTMITFIPLDIYAYDTRLTGFHPNAQSPFDDFMNVDI